MKLIYISPLPWVSFTQRPHEYVEYFHAATGGDVLWIDPYPTRLPRFSDVFSRPLHSSLTRKTPTWLKIIRPVALPIEPIPVIAQVNQLFWTGLLNEVLEFANAETQITIGKPSLLALILLKKLTSATSTYDAMDDFSEFYSGMAQRSMLRYENAICQHSTKMLTSSSYLKNKFLAKHPDVKLVLNGCRPDLPLAQHPATETKRKIIGYIGTIAQWFDWDLVITLASSNPDCIFRLIGPQHVLTPKSLPLNIEIHPALNHAEAIKAMQQFDIGLIPFKLDRLTNAVDPIKYYEYRAMGLPVLSTGFGEMSLRVNEPTVFIINAEEPAQQTLKKALACSSEKAETEIFRMQNTWQTRFLESKIFG